MHLSPILFCPRFCPRFADFSETINKIQGNDLSALEIDYIITDLLVKLETRKNECFIPSMAKHLFKKLEQDGQIQQSYLVEKVTLFYGTAYDYLKAWKHTNKNFEDFSCFMLKDIPNRETFTSAIESLVQDCDVLDINIDDVFDEFTMLKTLLEFKRSEDKNWFLKRKIPKKWSEIFIEFKEKNIPHKNLKKIVDFLMRLPGTNGFIERVFSLVNDFWSTEKAQMLLETVETSVKVNNSESCTVFS